MVPATTKRESAQVFKVAAIALAVMAFFAATASAGTANVMAKEPVGFDVTNAQVNSPSAGKSTYTASVWSTNGQTQDVWFYINSGTSLFFPAFPGLKIHKPSYYPIEIKHLHPGKPYRLTIIAPTTAKDFCVMVKVVYWVKNLAFQTKQSKFGCVK